MQSINDKIMASGFCNRHLGEDIIDYKIRVDKLRQLVQHETPQPVDKPKVEIGNEILLSICTYKSGAFQIMIQDDKHDLTFEGERKLEQDELEWTLDIAPACVFTKYKRV